MGNASFKLAFIFLLLAVTTCGNFGTSFARVTDEIKAADGSCRKNGDCAAICLGKHYVCSQKRCICQDKAKASTTTDLTLP